MQQAVADVALVTERRYEASVAAPGDGYLNNILQDDRLLQNALSRHGLSSVRIDWSRPEVDWSAYRCAVFRSTWDYFNRFEEFSAWLDRLATSTLALNPLPLIRWNLDKHYLRDLQNAGVPVVETVYVERGSSFSVADLLMQTGWEQAVVKPCISGAARHTYRVNSKNAEDIDAKVGLLIAEESFLLQPFQQNIVLNGEDSLMVIDRRDPHSVRKIAKAGDFRVQDDHGGTASVYQPTDEQIELAERAFAACDHAPAYGRVDMVRDNRGCLAIMELELIEPEMWFRLHPPAADAMANAIAARLASPESFRD